MKLTTLCLALVLTGVLSAQQLPPAPAPAQPAVTPQQLTHTEHYALQLLLGRFQQVQQDIRNVIADTEVAHPGYTLDPGSLVLVKKAVIPQIQPTQRTPKTVSPAKPK